MPAWRALRVVAERQGQNRMAIEPPFVGRAEELRMLKEMLHATGREGKARVVSVIGIGGIGKSRLAWELLEVRRRARRRRSGGTTAAVRRTATASRSGRSARWSGCAPGSRRPTHPGVSRSKLAASVAQHVPDEDERQWLEPRLAFLLGLEERPTGGGDELFAAWRTFFERISERGTVAMVFEDLQWADAGLLDFIESLLEWSRNRPIFVVTLARPELARPPAELGRRHAELPGVCTSSRSPDATMAELVRGMVPGG